MLDIGHWIFFQLILLKSATLTVMWKYVEFFLSNKKSSSHWERLNIDLPVGIHESVEYFLNRTEGHHYQT